LENVCLVSANVLVMINSLFIMTVISEVSVEVS